MTGLEGTDRQEVTGRALLNAAYRDRRTLGTLAVVVILVAVTLAVILPSKYQSEVILLPSAGQSDISRLGSLAASVGLNVASTGGSGNLSPELFQNLVTSDYLLSGLLSRSFPLRADDGAARPLTELLGGENVDENIEKLRDVFSVSYDRIVGLLQVRATTKDPALSKSLLDSVVVMLADWTAVMRKQGAVRARDFISARIDSIQHDLDERRSALQRFQVQNRSVSAATSPALARQLEELELEVRLREAAYTTLVQQGELARMEAERDTPLLQVVDPARERVEPSGPNRKLIVASGIAAALALIVVGAWLRI